jgi:hypothetical protein
MSERLFKDVETQYGGGMKFAEGFILKISGDSGSNAIEGLIVQNLDIRANRPVTVLYDLTSNKVYYVAGRCTTQIGLQRVCGPRGIIGDYYATLGNVCNAGKNNMSFSFPPGCEPGAQSGTDQVSAADFNVLTAKNCILHDVQFVCNVQNYVISENCQIQGSELHVDRLNN